VYRSQLREAIRAAVVHSPTTYSWFGLSSPRLPARVERALTPKTARDHLLHTLRSRLYSDFYVKGRAAPSGWEVRSSVASRGPFVADLSAANTGSGYWVDGWTVGAVGDGGDLVVERRGLELTVGAADCSEPPAPGRTVGIRFPKELRSMSPGYYVACGDRLPDEDGRYPLVRLYWNLRAAGAVPFVRSATSCLNEAGVPFRLKVVNDPRGFTRCDAAVVYLVAPDLARAGDLLQAVHRQMSPHLNATTPALTKRLAPGLGYAEDPGGDESFGQHRCRQLADGIIRAYERRARRIDDRLAVVAARFAEDGVDVDEPYRAADRSPHGSEVAL
jgi:HopA1 effector protein family